MEYDKELASRLLTETMRELSGYLISVKAKEDDESFLTICALECFAEYHIRHLFYKKLLNMWPDKNYMHAKDLIVDLITIGGKIEDDETTLKMLWRKADGHDVNMGKMFWRVEDSPYGIYLGFYDGFVGPLNFSYSSSYSAEAIFIMDDMSKSIWKRIPSVLPLLNMLDPDEIKKRQEEIKKAHPTFRVMRKSCSAYSLSLKYLSSLKPYALRFITFILLFIPSTLAVEI